MNKRKFLVVEDDAAFARSIVRLLATYGKVIAVGTVRESMSALRAHPDLSALIVDLGLLDGSGLEVLAEFRAGHAAIPALVVTGSHEPASINRAFELGAQYIVKPFNGARLRQFVEMSVIRGRLAVSGTSAQLTKREREVVQRAQLGHDNKSIAYDLGIAHSTVRVLVARAEIKLGVSTRQELLRQASADPDPHDGAERA
jgi:two-component system response regulator FixJ